MPVSSSFSRIIIHPPDGTGRSLRFSRGTETMDMFCNGPRDVVLRTRPWKSHPGPDLPRYSSTWSSYGTQTSTESTAKAAAVAVPDRATAPKYMRVLGIEDAAAVGCKPPEPEPEPELSVWSSMSKWWK
jgi:hypothetical protein